METLLSWLCNACFSGIYMINPAREPFKYALTERVEGQVFVAPTGMFNRHRRSYGPDNSAAQIQTLPASRRSGFFYLACRCRHSRPS